METTQTTRHFRLVYLTPAHSGFGHWQAVLGGTSDWVKADTTEEALKRLGNVLEAAVFFVPDHPANGRTYDQNGRALVAVGEANGSSVAMLDERYSS